MRFFGKIQNAFRWSSAIDSASEGDFSGARAKLESIDPTNLGIPNREFFLLKAFVLMKLNSEDAKPTIAKALNAIDASKNLKEEERVYLRTYAEWVLASMYNNSPKAPVVELRSGHLNEVPERIKSLFPLN